MQRINTLIAAGNLTQIELAQLYGARQALLNSKIRIVQNVSQLPIPGANIGVLYLVADELAVYYSNGELWLRNFTTTRVTSNIFGVGYNQQRQLGDTTNTNRSSPVSVVGGIGNWVQVVAQGSRTFALATDGTIWQWGATSLSSPVTFASGSNNWRRIERGGGHLMLLQTNGSLWGWGLNQYGQIGNGSTSFNVSSPVSTLGGITNWTEIACGRYHTLGVTAEGTMWAWGRNYGGGLGIGSTSPSSTLSPVRVSSGNITWRNVSAGNNHTVAVARNGVGWSWGRNLNGKLGIGVEPGTTASALSPVSIVGNITNWSVINTSWNHNLGITTSGVMWAWGYNGTGTLGDNTVTDRNSPVSVVGGISNWRVASAGAFHSAAITTTGVAWAWGTNTDGRLGDNTTISKASPVSIVGGITNWASVSTSGHTMLISAPSTPSGF